MIHKSHVWKAKFIKSVELSSTYWVWYNPQNMKKQPKTRAELHPKWSKEVFQNEVNIEFEN